MPDSRESNSQSPAQKSNSRSRAKSIARPRVRAHAGDTLADLQTALLAKAIELRAIEESLAALVEDLPTPDARFGALEELRGMVDCVRSDLLSDAMMTLERAAITSEGDLHRLFYERQRQLVP